MKWIAVLIIGLVLWILVWDAAVLGCRLTVWMGTKAQTFPVGL